MIKLPKKILFLLLPEKVNFTMLPEAGVHPLHLFW